MCLTFSINIHCSLLYMECSLMFPICFFLYRLLDILVSYFQDSTTGRDFCVPCMLCLYRRQSHNCVPAGEGNLDCPFVFFQA